MPRFAPLKKQYSGFALLHSRFRATKREFELSAAAAASGHIPERLLYIEICLWSIIYIID